MSLTQQLLLRALAELGERARVVSHAAHAVSVDDAEGVDDAKGAGGAEGAGGAVRILLDNGDEVHADVVLYALGHTGAIPDDQHALLLDFASRHGLFYLSPAFTADADTSAIEAQGEELAQPKRSATQLQQERRLSEALKLPGER